jgi:ribonuclease BN (tRNA processing enzyme)
LRLRRRTRSGGRFSTCLAIGARRQFPIDCGASSLPALERLGIARDDIDLILITHPRRSFRRIVVPPFDAQFTRADRPLVIAGPEGIETRLTGDAALFEKSSKQQL